MPEAKPSKRPLQVFFSYAHEDEALRDELAKHLNILKRQGMIATWHDRRIEPGEEWAGKIAENLKIADLILLLVSADFLDSDYIQDVELQHALARHQNNTAQVIPIILRDCLWRQSAFAQLQALPTDGHPIVSDRWHNRDAAWLDVVEGIFDIIQKQLVSLPQEKELNATDIISTTPFNQPLIEVQNEQTFYILDNQGSKHTLSLVELPNISKRSGKQAWKNAKYWKKVHKLTEKLYSEYSLFYIHIICCKEANDLQNINKADMYKKIAQDLLKQQRIRFPIDELKKLPRSVSRTNPVLILYKFPIFYNAIMRSLGSPPGSPEFNNSLRLAEKIRELLLNTLRVADLILEDYFSRSSTTQIAAKNRDKGSKVAD